MSIELATRAAAGKLDPEVCTWLANGLKAYVDGAESNLEAALGLNHFHRTRERNTALLDAARHLSVKFSTPWELAGALAIAIRNFETRVCPPGRAINFDGLSPLNKSIFKAFRTGVRVPRTQENIHKLLR
ncbi:MAG: hypothetical protein PHD19_08825 [Dechloromonas sp.]|nr:hypothetical protein [Dechloromonas sp.]